METLKGKEIKQILSHHLKSIKTKTFIAIINKNSLGYPRFAFIASKRFSKKAVVRNRAKRLLREAIRINFSSLKNLSYDIVLIARKYISEAKLQDVNKDIFLLLKELRECDEKTVNTVD